MISAEMDISKYINCKTSVFIKVLKIWYEKYNENKILWDIKNNLNDELKYEKLKNL